MGVFRSLEPTVNFFRVRHPLNQLLWCRSIGHQEGKDFLGRLDEKLSLFVLRRLKERGRKSLGFGTATQLIGRPPIGATLVERVQDDIATRRLIEALHELARRVVDDSSVAPALHLAEYLKHEGRLTRAGVPDDLHVLGFGSLRNAKHGRHVVGLEADAVTLHRLVELVWRQHLRALQATPVLQLLLPLNVLEGGNRKEEQEDNSTAENRKLEESHKRFATIDDPLQIVTEAGVNEVPFGCPEEERIPPVASVLRESEWDVLLARLLSPSEDYVVIHGRAGSASCAPDKQ